MSARNLKTKGTYLVLLCVTLWALIPVVAKLGQTSLNNHQFLFWSSLVSFVTLLIIACFKGNVSEVRHYKTGDWIKLTILGLLGTYIYYLLLYFGYAQTNGVEVLVFQYTWPIWIIAFSFFILKEQINISKIIAIILGLIGMIVVVTKGEFQNISIADPEAIGLVVTGAGCFALYSVLSKNIKKDPYTVVAFYFFCACVASLGSMIYFSAFALPTFNEFFPILINGIFVNGVSYLLWLKALKSTEASYLAPFVFITPLLSGLYLILFFDEPFMIVHVIGLIFIVAGGLVNSVRQQKSKV